MGTTGSCVYQMVQGMRGYISQYSMINWRLLCLWTLHTVGLIRNSPIVVLTFLYYYGLGVLNFLFYKGLLVPISS
jgi:hypothetical protein